MKFCKDLNIDKCFSCLNSGSSNYIQTYCLLNSWIEYFKITTNDQVINYLKSRVNHTSFQNYYFNNALKYHNPSLFELWEKILLLK